MRRLFAGKREGEPTSDAGHLYAVQIESRCGAIIGAGNVLPCVQRKGIDRAGTVVVVGPIAKDELQYALSTATDLVTLVATFLIDDASLEGARFEGRGIESMLQVIPAR